MRLGNFLQILGALVVLLTSACGPSAQTDPVDPSQPVPADPSVEQPGTEMPDGDEVGDGSYEAELPYPGLHCQSTRSFIYEEVEITSSEGEISFAMQAGTDVFLNGSFEWPAMGRVARATAFTFAETECTVSVGEEGIYCLAENPGELELLAGDHNAMATFAASSVTLSVGPAEGTDDPDGPEILVEFSAVGPDGERVETSLPYATRDCGPK